MVGFTWPDIRRFPPSDRIFQMPASGPQRWDEMRWWQWWKWKLVTGNKDNQKTCTLQGMDTYPTLGKFRKSSSKWHFLGDMLVLWRVLFSGVSLLLLKLVAGFMITKIQVYSLSLFLEQTLQSTCEESGKPAETNSNDRIKHGILQTNVFSKKHTHPNQLIFSWWFGILGMPLCHNPFHKGILGIQTTNPNHHLTLSWPNVPIIWYPSPLQGNQPPKRVLNVLKMVQSIHAVDGSEIRRSPPGT